MVTQKRGKYAMVVSERATEKLIFCRVRRSGKSWIGVISWVKAKRL